MPRRSQHRARYIDYVVRERERWMGGEREDEYVRVNQSNAGRAKHVGVEQPEFVEVRPGYTPKYANISPTPPPPAPLSIAHNRGVRCNSVVGGASSRKSERIGFGLICKYVRGAIYLRGAHTWALNAECDNGGALIDLDRSPGESSRA